jgi:hypothetical protein
MKPTKAMVAGVSPLHPSKLQRAAPAHTAIANRAYEIWLSRGREMGNDQKHWFQAELQLRHG